MKLRRGLLGLSKCSPAMGKGKRSAESKGKDTYQPESPAPKRVRKEEPPTDDDDAWGSWTGRGNQRSSEPGGFRRYS
eukprot:7494918-Karenia_brevis.AAC.1